MIFINQAAGQLFVDVVEQLSRLPGQHYLFTGTNLEEMPRVKIVKFKRFQKETAIRRIFTWGIFTLQAFFRLFRYASGQHLLIVTIPPMNIWLGPLFKYFKKAEYSCLIYDIYPESFKVAGMDKLYFFLSFVWRKLNALSLSGAANVITLSDEMAAMLSSHLPDNKLKIKIIDNWVDTEFIRPVSRADNIFAKELDIQNKFIVSYSGSIGETRGIETIIDCAKILAKNADILFLIIGNETKGRKIQELSKHDKFSNFILLPYQPPEIFKYVAAVPDISLVMQKPGGQKSSMPSKTYTIMAAGTAIMALADNDSYLSRIITENECGIVIPPRDVEAMAKGILHLRQHKELLNKYKGNARRTAISKYSKSIQCAKYVRIFTKE